MEVTDQQPTTALTTEQAQFLLTPVGQRMQKFELAQREAQVYYTSTIVPAQYQGKDKAGNVMIAVDMAERMQMNPLQVMQNLYIVHGNPAWSSKFLIAMFNMSGRYTTLAYESTGKRDTDSMGMRCFAYELSDTKRENRLNGPWVTIAIAKKEGWYGKNGSKWQTMPELMLRYRAAAQFINTQAPELSMGLRTVEEAEDIAADTPQQTRDEAVKTRTAKTEMHIEDVQFEEEEQPAQSHPETAPAPSQQPEADEPNF